MSTSRTASFLWLSFPAPVVTVTSDSCDGQVCAQTGITSAAAGWRHHQPGAGSDGRQGAHVRRGARAPRPRHYHLTHRRCQVYPVNLGLVVGYVCDADPGRQDRVYAISLIDGIGWFCSATAHLFQHLGAWTDAPVLSCRKTSEASNKKLCASAMATPHSNLILSC